MSDDEVGLADRVARTGEDEIALRFTPRERAILGALLQDLEAVLAAPHADDDADEDGPEDDRADHAPPDPDRAVRARLYPTAVPDDERADASFRRLVHADLEAGRRERLAAVVATLDATVIDDHAADAWLHVLNDVRLVMGTRLDATDETEGRPLDPEDPDAAARMVYAYTGWVLGQFVDVMAATLPDADGDEGVLPAAEEG